MLATTTVGSMPKPTSTAQNVVPKYPARRLASRTPNATPTSAPSSPSSAAVHR